MSNRLPLLPLRDAVIFPHIPAPLFVGRAQSVRALESIGELNESQLVLLTAQKNSDSSYPSKNDIYNVGVVAKLLQCIKLPNNTIKLVVEGDHRVKLFDIQNGEFLTSDYQIIPDAPVDNMEQVSDMLAEVIIKFSEYVKIHDGLNMDLLTSLQDQKDQYYIVNILASHLMCKVDVRQQLLETVDIRARIQQLYTILDNEIIFIRTEQEIQSQVKKRLEKSQRDFYLNEQMKVIQKELGDPNDKSEVSELERKMNSLNLSNEAKEKAQSELKKLKMMSPVAAEAAVIRSYLDVLLGMPWGKCDKHNVNIQKAAEVLDKDHYGLEKVKGRIIEYLAIIQRSKKLKGPILCFVGSPGVGKTSLGRSIASAIGRKYARFSMGGVRDEAEIRGHRRTYLGSMPGKIISIIKTVKTDNPVIVLDEIDKVGGVDFRGGDPYAALLEVLDAEQNKHFADHYLEIPYDISKVMFIATANSLNTIPSPLLDRMEVIHVPGYTEDEKMRIAKDYLIPKQLEMHSMKVKEFNLPDATILDVIRYYTRESGVRTLEREIGALIRKALRKILSDKTIKSIFVNPDDLEELLGVKKYSISLAESDDMVGATTGLAYTSAGGELLYIEAVMIPGKGQIKMTGKLGEVMQESAQAAFSFFRSRASSFGIKEEVYKNYDIHLHVPEGATPKDGPSAGIAILTTITSIITGIPVRKDVAMTGEITLRGKVLPIGGLREKLLAARRGGIKTVLIPEENMRDLKDVPNSIKNEIKIIPVSDAASVLKLALTRELNKMTEPRRISKSKTPANTRN